MLNGRVAIVTGAGSGIGRASAIAFAEAGALVAASDIDESAAQETAALIAKLGNEALPIRCDVADQGDVAACVARVQAELGPLAIAHNNAGIDGHMGRRLADHSDENWQRVLAVNLTGVFNCLRTELSVMAANGRGAIVNTASIAGLRGMGRAAPYVASKHGVVGLTRDAALDYASMGIRVNAICPGVIETPMVASASDAMIEGLLKSTPLRRLGTAEEIAAAVVWLSSDAASFVTGQCLAADGGFTAR